MTRKYIELQKPDANAIRNAATKNKPGDWVIYGRVEVPEDTTQWEFNVPSNAVMEAVRHEASAGRISQHIAKGEDGMSMYVFKVLDG